MVDWAGPWKVRVKLDTGEITDFTFHMCSMIDSGTGWVEFSAIANTSGKNASKAVERYWLFSMPRPAECGHDNDPEFMFQEFWELLSEYNIKFKLTTIKNPQAQTLVERMHHTLTNQLWVRVLEEDAWIEDTDFMMQHFAWVLWTTVPANMHHAPGTLAFGMDMLYGHKIQIDWGLHKERERIKQHIANNIKEKWNRRHHNCKEGCLLLIQILPYEKNKRLKLSKHAEGP